MNPFVNFAKRDVALPGGCSDLIDVQRLNQSTKPNALQPTPPIKLTDLESTISNWLRLPAQFASLWIDAGAGAAIVALFRGEEGLGLRTLIAFQSAREPKVREFLNDSIAPPIREKSWEFGNDSYLSIMGSLVSSENLAAFVRSLLTSALDLPEDIPLQVQCNDLVEEI